jgi:hypothetical protein
LATIEKANKKAIENGRKQAVVEMDRHEGRKIYIVDADYLDSDEFEAFDGYVVYITE